MSQRLIGTGAVITAALHLGRREITLRVTDSQGFTDTDEVVVMVDDTTAPTISVELSPSALWPPNNKMVAVHATVRAFDLCTGPEIIVLASVTGGGPEDVEGAETGTDDFDILLRASRGRLYEVSYSAFDYRGNGSDATATIAVPHDRGLGR